MKVNRLKMLRLKTGLTMQEVAQYIGYSTAQLIFSWETDRSFPPEPALRKICALYKANYEEVASEIIMKMLTRKCTALISRYGIRNTKTFEVSKQRAIRRSA